MSDVRVGSDPMTRAGKWFLRSFIGFLSISALFAIVNVLSGDIGEFEARVLATTSVIAAASICALCCSAYAGRGGNTVPAGAGIALAVLCAGMVIPGVWTEPDSVAYWKTAGVLAVFAIAFAHALALLAVRLPARHAWIRITTTLTIGALACVIAALVIYEFDSEVAFKVITVLAILAALETLVIPILARFAKTPAAPDSRVLVLTEGDDGLYRDGYGRVYEVRESGPPPPEA